MGVSHPLQETRAVPVKTVEKEKSNRSQEGRRRACEEA